MKKSRIKKILVGVLGFFILSIFVINTFILPSVIRKQFSNAKIGTIELKVDRIKTHFIPHSIRLSGVQIGDSTGDFSLNVRVVRLKKIGIFNLITQRRIRANQLIIQEPVFRLRKGYQFPKTEKQDSEPTTKPLRILVKRLEVNKGEFSLFDTKLQNDSIVTAQFDLGLKDLELGPDTARFRYSNFGLEEFNIALANIRYYTGDGIYRIQVGDLNFDTRTAELLTNDIQVIPLMDRYEVGNRAGFQTDWFDVQVQTFQMENINIQKLLSHQQFFLHKIEVNKMKAEAFRDVRLPMPDKPDTKLIPDMIAAIPIPVHADSLQIHNADIRYSERAKNSDAAGHVDLNELEALCENFTNIDSLIRFPRELNVNTKLLNSALLNVSITLSSKNFPEADRMRGQLKSMPFTAFNTMIENGMSVRFTDGVVHRLEFDFTYNNDYSNGKLLMDYENLRVELLSRKNQRDKKLESGILNNLVLNESNLPGDKKYREGTINFERDKKKSTYNFWWKSILSGMKYILTF